MRRIPTLAIAAFLAALFAGSAAVSSAAGPSAPPEADWQASAKGLSVGPLSSLTIQVRLGDSADLFMRGGTLNTGWGSVGPWDIPLGSVAAGEAEKTAAVRRWGDWSGGGAEVSFQGGASLTLHASQLSPGIAIQVAGKRLRLFAGLHDRTVTLDGGKMQVRGHIAGKPLPKTPITPAHLALIRGKEVKVFDATSPVSLPRGDDAAILVWWGASSHFLNTALPLGGSGMEKNAYQADCPLLLVFDRLPASVAPVKEGGLDFFEKAFAEASSTASHRVAILPVFGAGHLPSDVTAKWPAAFPQELAARCARLAGFAREYPLSARQSFRYDAAKDTATFAEKVTFLQIGPGGRKLAPLPPAAAIAMGSGLKIAVLEKLEDLGVVTAFGPVVGLADAETISWSVQGLARYVAEPPPAAGKGKAPPDLEAELRDQLAKMLDADKPLAPWAYADNVPISASRGEYYWGEPGEALALLSDVRPAADAAQRARLAEYMTALYQAHPPHNCAIIPPDAGPRRGGYDLGPCQLAKWAVQDRGGRISPYALYGAARYHEAVGTKPSAEAWQGYRKVLAEAFAEQAWGTLYLLGHADRLLPWEKQGLTKEQMQARQRSPYWRGDRPAAVVNVNRLLAGAIGGVRLARQAGDAAGQEQAWWLLARCAVLRFAMGKYAAWQYGAGLAPLPADKEWFWQWRGRFPQSWGGDLETNDWSKPADDVRQVVEFAPDRVELAHWAGVVGDAWTQRCTAQLVAFRYMTPELAMFLRDHLGPESAALVRRVEWNQPAWYAAFAEAILGWEHNMNHPSDAYQVFMAHARVLGTGPEQLTRWLDVPWLERGDLFYLNKLAATILAYRRGE